jgi:hypothetical protein
MCVAVEPRFEMRNKQCCRLQQVPCAKKNIRLKVFRTENINLDDMKLQKRKPWGDGCMTGVTAVKNSVKGMYRVSQLVACWNVPTVVTIRRCLASNLCNLWYPEEVL